MKYADIRNVIYSLIEDGKPHTNAEIITALFGAPCHSRQRNKV